MTQEGKKEMSCKIPI